MTAIATETGAVRWMRRYETVYVLRPDVSPEGAEQVAQRIQEIIERFGGKLTLVDHWGKLRTSYVVRHMGKKYTRGIYVQIQYLGAGGLVHELERHFRMLDDVMRFLTVKLEDMVDPSTVEVDPEEVAFLPVEEADEADEEPPLPHEETLMAAAGVGLDAVRARAGSEEAEEQEATGTGEESAEEDAAEDADTQEPSVDGEQEEA